MPNTNISDTKLCLNRRATWLLRGFKLQPPAAGAAERAGDWGSSASAADEDRGAFFTTEDETCAAEIHPDVTTGFKIRPISREWRIAGRRAAYRTAVCNVAYIIRDKEAVDAFGRMPNSFGQRAYELRCAGLLLPGSAPKWASDGYNIWREADAFTDATGDPSAASAWHVVGEIPIAVPPDQWEGLVTSFLEKHLAHRGAAVAWAVHALEGDDGTWIIKPHFHAVVSLRYWRHNSKLGQRHPYWLGGRNAHNRLMMAWMRRCKTARMVLGTKAPGRAPWLVE